MKKICLLFLIILVLAGCATTVRYFPYTQQRFPAKSFYYFVTISPGSQHPPASEPYTVIGKVQVSGHASDGVTDKILMDQAKTVARKRGADAIINVKTKNFGYSGMYIVPGHVSYRSFMVRRHEEVVVARYHPERQIPYSDILLTFEGDLIVFSPLVPQANK